MQEETPRPTVLPNRKERRRRAALTKRPARPTCACCRPAPGVETQGDEDVPGGFEITAHFSK
jgi:hypothetical protein